MSSLGAVPAMSGDPYAGFTPTEQAFLQALSNLLRTYPKFGGDTPIDQALATTFDVSVTVKGPRAFQVPCKKICHDWRGMPYCCGM
jgi:hypothetical protein